MNWFSVLTSALAPRPTWCVDKSELLNGVLGIPWEISDRQARVVLPLRFGATMYSQQPVSVVGGRPGKVLLFHNGRICGCKVNQWSLTFHFDAKKGYYSLWNLSATRWYDEGPRNHAIFTQVWWMMERRYGPPDVGLASPQQVTWYVQTGQHIAATFACCINSALQLVFSFGSRRPVPGIEPNAIVVPDSLPPNLSLSPSGNRNQQAVRIESTPGPMSSTRGIGRALPPPQIPGI